MVLRRLILEFSPDGIQARVLYRRQDGPNPGTVRRRREVEALARSGLTAALAALDAGETEDLGTSGYQVREDTLHLSLTSSAGVTKEYSPKQVKKGA